MNNIILSAVFTTIFGLIGLGGFKTMKNKNNQPQINYTGHKSRQRNLNKKSKTMKNLIYKQIQIIMMIHLLKNILIGSMIKNYLNIEI